MDRGIYSTESREMDFLGGIDSSAPRVDEKSIPRIWKLTFRAWEAQKEVKQFFATVFRIRMHKYWA
jgi:hypothetical protein